MFPSCMFRAIGAEAIRWLLFQRLDGAEWAPVYGPLSGFAGGAVVYAMMLGLPGCLAFVSAKRIRAGQKEYRGVFWWAVLMWPFMLLSSSIHMQPLGSRSFYLLWAVVGVLGIPWVIYGFWVIVPLLLRRGTRG